VEDLAHLDPSAPQVLPGLLDVAHDQVHVLHRARRGGADAVTDGDRAVRPGRGEVHDPEILSGGVVQVLAEPDPVVEGLCPVDVGNRKNDQLKLVLQHCSTVARPAGARPRDGPWATPWRPEARGSPWGDGTPRRAIVATDAEPTEGVRMSRWTSYLRRVVATTRRDRAFEVDLCVEASVDAAFRSIIEREWGAAGVRSNMPAAAPP